MASVQKQPGSAAQADIERYSMVSPQAASEFMHSDRNVQPAATECGARLRRRLPQPSKLSRILSRLKAP